MISFSLNFVWSLRLEASITSTELPLFNLKITQDYIVVYCKLISETKLVKSIKVFPANIKPINPVQRYPHIIELFACIRNMFVLMFYSNKFFNFFRNMFNSKTVEINNFNISTIQSNPMCASVWIFIKVYYIFPFFILLGKLSLEWTPLNLGLLW